LLIYAIASRKACRFDSVFLCLQFSPDCILRVRERIEKAISADGLTWMLLIETRVRILRVVDENVGSELD
jgi:hypothetical protein